MSACLWLLCDDQQSSVYDITPELKHHNWTFCVNRYYCYLDASVFIETIYYYVYLFMYLSVLLLFINFYFILICEAQQKKKFCLFFFCSQKCSKLQFLKVIKKNPHLLLKSFTTRNKIIRLYYFFLKTFLKCTLFVKSLLKYIKRKYWAHYITTAMFSNYKCLPASH